MSYINKSIKYFIKTTYPNGLIYIIRVYKQREFIEGYVPSKDATSINNNTEIALQSR